MKHAGPRLVVLLALHVLCAGRAYTQSPAAIPPDELTKQSAIYQSRGEDVPQGYVVGRSLSSYLYVLPDGFRQRLAKLGPDERWLDIGAGEGRAVMDYCSAKYDGTLLKGAEQSRGKAQAVAISIEDRRTVEWHRAAATLDASRIRYLFGRRLREYSMEELGKFQVITDVMGGFSYARDLSLFMQKTLDFLEPGGAFYTVLQDVRTESGTSRPYYEDSPFLTEIVRRDGSEVGMCSWLKSISCVEVACESKPDWSPPLEVYRIRKTCDAVAVPALTPVHFEAGTPPERRFVLNSSAK
jgi:SAM-dependent methyltransferase